MEDEKKEVVTSDGITDKFGDTEQSLATEEAVRIGNKYLADADLATVVLPTCRGPDRNAICRLVTKWSSTKC